VIPLPASSCLRSARSNCGHRSRDSLQLDTSWCCSDSIDQHSSARLYNLGYNKRQGYTHCDCNSAWSFKPWNTTKYHRLLARIFRARTASDVSHWHGPSWLRRPQSRRWASWL